MCPECSEAWMSWLDYRPPAPLAIASIGNERGRVRHGTRVIETIRSQQKLIKEMCARNHQV